MKSCCPRLLLSLLLLGVSPGGTALAQSPDGEAAAQAFAAASRLYKNRDYVRAIAEFERAYKLRPHYQVQCSIARSYENLGRVVEAAERYRRCLQEGAEASAIATRIQTSLRAMEARIAWIDLVGSEGATIQVDGLPAGITPRRLPLNPGRHAIEVRRSGWRTAEAVIEVLGGEQRTLELKLSRLPAPAPQPEASVRPGPAPTLPAGPDPEPPRGRRRLHPAWFWTTASLGVALAGGAIVFGAQALSRRSDYEADPTEAGLDRFLQSRMLANLFWGLAGAAAASSTVLFFFTDFRGQPRGETAAGLGLAGRF